MMPEQSVDSQDTHPQVNEVTYDIDNTQYTFPQFFWPGASYYSNAYFGAGAGPIVMTNVRCTATENRLIDCPFDLNNNCGHNEDAGVQCYSSTSGTKFKMTDN